MAEPYKSTPASRVFGMGLPRRKVSNPGTIFGIEVDEPRWSLDPRLRRDMAQEQQMAIQEAALANEQRKQEMELQGQEAMGRAFEELEQGENIENIFRRNPAIAFSPQFGQFSQAAQFMQPSRASRALAPSLAKDLPGQYRSKYFELLNTPQYANDPLGAKTVIDTEMGIDEQRGRLAKVGIPLTGERKLLSPEEEEGLIFQHTAKKSDPQIAAMEKYLERLQKKRDSLEAAGKDQIPNPLASDKDPTIPKYIPSPEYENLEKEITDVDAQYGARMRGIFMPKATATAEDITSPAATDGLSERKDFKQKMDKLSGSAKPAADGAPVIPDLTPKERIQGIDVIKNDPDALLQATRSPQRSEKEKNEALAHLKKFVESPKFPFGTTTREANSRISNLMEQIKEAERNVRMIPELEAYRKAWTEEKKDMELKIKDFAKSRGVDFDLTLADLAKEEPASNDPEETFTVRDQFEEFLNKEYDYSPIARALSAGPLNIPAGRLMKFKDSEFAKEFGWLQPIPLLRLHIESGDVLDAYLAEKFPKQGDNQGQPTNVVSNTVPNITTKAEFDKLPIGAKFTFGNGEIRTKEQERKK